MTQNTQKEVSAFRFYFTLLLLASCLYLCIIIFRPFIEPMVLAACLASVFAPLYARMNSFFPGKRSLNSTLCCSAVFCMVIIPLIYILLSLGLQVGESYNRFGDFLSLKGDSSFQTIPTKEFMEYIPFGEELVQNYDFDLKSTLKQLATKLISLLQRAIAALVGTGANVITNFFFMLIILWIFFHSGHLFIREAMKISPLTDEQEYRIINEFKSMAKTTLTGTFATAFIQGVLGSVLFAFFGFAPVLFGVAIGFSSLIPFVGTALVWGPIGAYFLLTDNIMSGVILISLGALIGFSDNIIRPFLMKDGTEIHPGVLFLSILGGMYAFGFWGIIYGPIVVAVTKIAMIIYYEDYGILLSNTESEQKK